jgi:hypothetical protein
MQLLAIEFKNNGFLGQLGQVVPYGPCLQPPEEKIGKVFLS